MALNFPDSPANGDKFVDATTGESWTYEASTNSWTSDGLTTSAGIVYKGGIDITAAAPAGAAAGWQYTVTTGGTVDSSFTGLSGNIPVGTTVLFDGTNWQQAGVGAVWLRNGTTISQAVNGDNVFLKNASGTDNIKLNADGSATFADTVTVQSASNFSVITLKNSAQSYGIGTSGNNNSCRLYNSTSTTTLSQWMPSGDFYHGGGLSNGSDIVTPKIRLNATGTASFTGSVQIGGYPVSGAAAGLYLDKGGTVFVGNASASEVWKAYNDTTNALTSTIKADGSATFAGNVTAANITSDIRFKENLTPASSQLDDVKQLSALLKNWDWNDQAPMNEELRAQRFLGLVAQEAEKVCPQITYEVQRDEEAGGSYKALKHDVILMKLLGTVGELIAKNEALEAKVAALESK